jgi:cysteinyl-tRNA synthetase
MYVCGPTVYNEPHIGNARPAVVFDVLYRLLKKLYNNVTYVRNITDVDDKIYQKALQENTSIKNITAKYTEIYHDDMKSLNVLLPDIQPKATEHIQEMISLIDKLVKNGNAYISEKHVYFDVLSYNDYGTFSRKNLDDLVAGSRINVSSFKKNPLDFVLWKPIDENFKVGWESPWGIGRPGWHIECSAMSLKYLGEEFDIHGGGIDLIFPHHENEIAQSCVISKRKTMAKYWIHNGHVNVNDVKMSKSIGNSLTIRDVLQKYDGEVIRTAFLLSHYSSPMNFNDETQKQAKKMLDRWYRTISNIEFIDGFNVISTSILGSLLDNLNTPKVISVISDIIDSLNKKFDNYIANVLVYSARELLGILENEPSEWLHKTDQSQIDEINDLISERNLAKSQGKYSIADAIRANLLKMGIVLEDTNEGTTWRKT